MATERRPALGRPALGKGLSALIPETPAPAPAPRTGITELDVTVLTPNSHQPRLQMDDARLEELAASIKEHGIIQPILVRKQGDQYRIIAGERRWRAAQRAGLTKVPVVLRETGSDQTVLELALIENIQRENLNPVDEALAYQRLSDEFGLTQEQISAAVGKERSTVANIMRLLRLPEEVRTLVATGALSMGHAKILGGLSDPEQLLTAARGMAMQEMSVRQAENFVRYAFEPDPVRANPAPKPAAGAAAGPDVHTRAAEDRMRFALGTKVRINRKGKGGTIVIDFTNEDELNRLYEHIVQPR